MTMFRFGAFELNQDGTLWCDGALVPLSPMQRRLMLSFCRRPRQVISKVELMRDVWGHEDVSEVSLARTVHGLRRRLAHVHESPELIRNVYGEGYLLTVSVVQPGEGGDAEALPDREPAAQRDQSLAASA
ncbi:MAG: winged helix-turn-helix domain-containing protein [Synechococcaceae cyanobacterium]|nr:winged helix-turn-helix domain-containing protein [Synechococcaceae cyanobacterium]